MFFLAISFHVFFSIFQIQIHSKLETRGVKQLLVKLFDIQKSLFSTPRHLKAKEKNSSWTADMVQQLRAFSGLLKNTCLIPIVYTDGLQPPVIQL